MFDCPCPQIWTRPNANLSFEANMNRNRAILSLLSAVAILWPVLAHAKKHPNVPEEFESAKTVFVETQEGDITDLNLDREDRKAILDIQDGFEKWGRYSLSRSRLDADLIVVLRKGRVWRDPSSNSTLPGSRTPSARPPLQNPADASTGPDGSTSQDGFRREKDRLGIYTLQSNGKLKGPIWSDEVDRGLESPGILLLQRLKSDVEKAYPGAPAKKQSTP